MSATERKKIVLVIHSLQAGGMERVMTELAINFSKNENLEVHLILYGIKRDIFYTLPKNIIIHKPKFLFKENKRFYSTIKTIFFIRKKVKKINPDTVLSFGVLWNNFVLLATLGLQIPIYVSDRSQPDKILRKFHETLRVRLYPKATGVILQTQQAKDIYIHRYRKLNIKVIGNPIRKIDNYKNLNRENIILMIGRLIESKHQDRLIKIFAKLNDSNWKLVLVGYDHLKQKNSLKLKQLINKLGLEERVIMAGKQSNVEKYYLKSKIFAFTSSSEGFPNVIGEAMSAGLPTVVYDCIAGPSEMIDDGENGFLIPLFDDDLFQKKMENLMEDEELRIKMGLKAKENIKIFDKDLISQQFLDFLLSHELK